jgi:hypothetical protein
METAEVEERWVAVMRDGTSADGKVYLFTSLAGW